MTMVNNMLVFMLPGAPGNGAFVFHMLNMVNSLAPGTGNLLLLKDVKSVHLFMCKIISSVVSFHRSAVIMRSTDELVIF